MHWLFHKDAKVATTHTTQTLICYNDTHKPIHSEKISTPIALWEYNWFTRCNPATWNEVTFGHWTRRSCLGLSPLFASPIGSLSSTEDDITPSTKGILLFSSHIIYQELINSNVINLSAQEKKTSSIPQAHPHMTRHSLQPRLDWSHFIMGLFPSVLKQILRTPTHTVTINYRLKLRTIYNWLVEVIPFPATLRART